MSFWLLLVIVCISGAIGGFANAIISDNGFALPRTERVDNGTSVLRPGYLGKVAKKHLIKIQQKYLAFHYLL
jgi:hypothetical protein